jgi:dihydrofolate reductase
VNELSDIRTDVNDTAIEWLLQEHRNRPRRSPDTNQPLEKPMRKIINSAFVSLDGVTADPSSWATFDHDSAGEAVQALQAFDGMLMGRGTYEYFADVMPHQTGPYADAINAIRKHVFSSTLDRADWNNSTIIRDDVLAAVTNLKQEDGRDLLTYGHGRLSQTLLEHHLPARLKLSGKARRGHETAGPRAHPPHLADRLGPTNGIATAKHGIRRCP